MYLILMSQAWFVDMVKARYVTIHESIATTVQKLASIQIDYLDAFTRHANRWYWFGNWQIIHDQVISWLLERNVWLFNWAQN